VERSVVAPLRACACGRTLSDGDWINSTRNDPSLEPGREIRFRDIVVAQRLSFPPNMRCQPYIDYQLSGYWMLASSAVNRAWIVAGDRRIIDGPISMARRSACGHKVFSRRQSADEYGCATSHLNIFGLKLCSIGQEEGSWLA
jgi:hypothetical protein